MSIRRVYIGLGCLYSRSGRPKVSPEYRQTDRRTLYPCYIAYLGARSFQPNIASALPTAHREIYRSKNVADRNTRSTVLFRRLKFPVCASQQPAANRKRSTKRIRDARDAATVARKLCSYRSKASLWRIRSRASRIHGTQFCNHFN